ncbi:unnamed protein product, partial [Brassica napus]
LAVRRPGKAPERAVPSPSPGRHEAVRSRHVSSSSSPPTVDGFGTGTPEPSPQSLIQSFSPVLQRPPPPPTHRGLALAPTAGYRSRFSAIHFRGYVQLGTVTRLPVHPASPVLLTKNGPLGALDSVGWLNKAATPSYLFKV